MTEQEVLSTVDGVIKKRQRARGEPDGATYPAQAPTREEFERLSAQVHGLNVQIQNLIGELRSKL